MVAVPPETPLKIPVVEPILATPLAVLLHVPPPEISLNVVLIPEQILLAPLIAEGVAFTVTGAVT